MKILIVRLSAIGDVIHTLPLLHSLRRKYPNAFIGWAIEDKAADIIEGNPLIDKIHIMPRKVWKARGKSLQNFIEFLAYIKEIRKQNYDIAIDVQELFKSGLIAFLSGAKRKIAHAGTREFASIFINEKLSAHDLFDKDKPIIERYLDAASYLNAPTDEIKFPLPKINNETKAYIDALLKDLDMRKPVIVFSPATIWPSKHWLENYWSELLDLLAENNNVIFSGVVSDIALIERITAHAKTKQYYNFAGKTNIKQLIELFNRTDILVAPDTGPAHIANATNKPEIICIFGSTAYKRSGPYGSQHESVSVNLPCQPCFERKCPLKEAKMACMAKISPAMIYEIISKKLLCIKK